jgi:SPP1 gp7 family putative phage head morphogenesis protein
MSAENLALVKETALSNLIAWKKSGVVKSLKYYSAEDVDVCAACKAHHGSIVTIEDGTVGVNLPPLGACSCAKCRCYLRPWDISTE